jgi:tape measure domain-containing protein
MGDTRLMVEINGEAGGLFSILAQVNRRLGELSGAASSTAGSAKASLAQIEAGATSLEGSFVKAGLSLGAIRSLLMGLKNVATEVLDANLELERSQRTLQMATGDGAGAMRFVRGLAKDLGLELMTTAKGYSMMAAAAKGTSMEGAEVQKVFTAVARATAAMSLSADQSHGVLLALSQMISKGKVQAEELRRQLGEHLPGAFNIAARAMGVTTMELDKMLVAGKVISTDFLPKFAVALTRSLGDAPEKAANSLQANINRMKTAFQALSYEVGQGGASSGLSAALKEIGDRLNNPDTINGARVFGANLGTMLASGAKLAGVLWDLRGGILGLGAAWLAVKVGAIVTGIGAWITAKRSAFAYTEAATLATVQETAATAGLTLNMNGNIAAQIASARAKNAAALAALENAFALGGMTGAEYAAQKAALAHASAKLIEAGAITTATVSARAYAAIMALVGGWIGLVAIALGGLILLWTKVGVSAAQAAANTKKFHDADMETIATWDTLGKKAKELDTSIRSGKLTKDEAALANVNMRSTLEKLEAAYPGFLKLLVDEKGHVRSIAEAWKMANDEKEKAMRLEYETANSGKKTLEEAIAQRKEWIKQREKILAGPEGATGSRTGDDNGQNRLLSYDKAKLKNDEEILRLQTSIADQAGAKWNAYAQITAATKAVKPGDTPDKGGKPVENTYAEEMLRILQTRLKDEQGLTLEQRERNELEQAGIDFAKEMDRIAGKREKEGWSDAKTLAIEADAKDTWLKKINIEIPKKYAGLRLDEQDALNKIEADRTKTHQEAIYRLEDEGYKQRYERGEINARQLIALETNAEETRYQEAVSALRARLDKKNNLSVTKQAQVNAQIEALEDQHNQRMKVLRGKAAAEDDNSSFTAGVKTYINQTRTALGNWKTVAMNIMQGVENAFAGGIKGILSGQMSLSEGLNAIWTGIADTIITALANIAAKYLVMTIAQKIFGIESGATALAAASAQEAVAAAGFFAAYAWMPWIGFGLAAANIAAMEGVMAAMKAKALVGAAEGGWFDRPTLAMIGEGTRPELVVPDTSFKDFARNLSANILSQERQSMAYQRQGAAYATAGAGGHGGGINLSGATIFTSNSTEMQNFLSRASKGYDRRNG